MLKQGSFLGWSALAAFATLGLGVSSVAQSQETASSSAVLEEIIVTARKREESAQEVPVAITALSQELTKSNIRNLADLNGFAPNVRIDDNPGRTNGSSIIIRGISPVRTDDNSFDSPIGVMIDGIHLGSLGGQVLENFDIERVEILRGPQGTLFGKNTVGGVVNVIRSRPTGEMGARVKATIGKWDQKEIRAVINTPIIEDQLAAKVFFTSIQNDGYIRNTYLEKRMPETDYQNYGITLLATPNDRFEALLTVEKFDDNSEIGSTMHNWNLAPGVASPPTDPKEPNFSNGFLGCTLAPLFGVGVPCRTNLDIPSTTEIDINNPAKTAVDAYTLNLSFDLTDNLRLVSVTGYRDMIEDRKFDFDGTFRNHITIERLNDYDQFSEELRLEGSWNNIDFVVGGYYWESEFEQDWVTGGEFWYFVSQLNPFHGYDLRNNTWGAPGPLLGAVPGLAETIARYPTPLEMCWSPDRALFFGQVWCDTGASLNGLGDAYTQRLFEHQVTESIAFYAQADWEFAPDWTLTAGLRWTQETKDFEAGQAYLGSVARQRVKNFPNFADLDNKWDEVSPKIGLSYRFTDDILFYASYAEGFHSGGFFGVNQNVSDFERDQYDPEFANSWEAGVKSQLLDNRVQFNAVFFLNDFKDKQEASVQFDATTDTVATVFDNVADAQFKGIEAELQFVANQYMSFFASVGWLDAEYKEFETDIDPTDNLTIIEDATHLIPRNAPEFTLGVGGTATWPVGSGEIELYAKYDWIDSIQTVLLNTRFNEVASRENLSAAATYRWNNLAVTVFGRNLTDEVFETPATIATLFASSTVTRGASWGLEVSMEL